MAFHYKFRSWQFSKNRLEAFSDGVFAIVITLLVLGIKIPHIAHPENVHEVFQVLKETSPEFFSWVVSFFFVAIIWLHHHQIMHMTTRCDYGVVWINNILLFFVTVLPFPASLMAEYPHQPIMIFLWGATVSITTFMLTWFYYYNTRNYLSDKYDKVQVRKNVRLSVFGGPFLYLVAALLSWVNVYITYTIYILVPLLYILPLDKELLPGTGKEDKA